ncbi:MAG: hypothetical protein R2705_10720 [Ilumatobacteraceae bacterium]
MHHDGVSGRGGPHHRSAEHERRHGGVLVGQLLGPSNISFNGYQSRRTHPLGNDDWALSILPINLEEIGPGANEISFSYRGTGFGEFVEKPGPMGRSLPRYRLRRRRRCSSSPPTAICTEHDRDLQRRGRRIAAAQSISGCATESIFRATASTYTTGLVTATDDGATFSV